ncbi:MAG: Type 1 glutamine amidotransferase-like domain-containing protein [Roseiflexaceae bacterium]|nr:Type 1 glutamine amidotransferase-like domain-containing protein [Roseiflexaceae bacterium]
MGYILLEGGAEFGGHMAKPDAKALELAGGPDAPVRFIPSAAAPDHNDERVGKIATAWFTQLGARNVRSLPIIDVHSADDQQFALELQQARLIYIPGGFPHYLGQTLTGSRCWRAVQQAYAAGAVVGGSSAGAMVVCQWYFDPARRMVVDGLGLVAHACVLPHHNTYGRSWSATILATLPDITLIGIDEQTGIIGSDGVWEVYGRATVTLYRKNTTEIYQAGQIFSMPDLVRG